MKSLVVIVGFIVLLPVEHGTSKLLSSAAEVTGCPIFGCSPGGWFSYQLNAPLVPTVKWESDIRSRVPHSDLGCVGNDVAVVCPTNSDQSVGYAAFSVDDGELLWQDSLLEFPPLPLLDVYGDVIGSDGDLLVQFRGDGSVLQPVIHLTPPMGPIFSLNLADNGILLLTSASGVLTTYFTNGVPGGTLTLHYKVNNDSGIFHPIASPVIQGHRSYLLTEFKAANQSSKENGLRRLFAIDLNDQFVGKIEVIWFVDLGKAIGFSAAALESSSLLVFNGIIFITTGSPEGNSTTNSTDFWVFEDEGNLSFMLYKGFLSVSDLSVFDQSSQMGKLSGNIDFQSAKEIYPLSAAGSKTVLKFRNHKEEQKIKKTDQTIIWGSSKSPGKITGFAVSSTVKLLFQINLQEIFKTTAEITSKVMTLRNETDSTDTLVFGISVMNKSDDFTYLLRNFSKSGLNNVNFVAAVRSSLELPSHGTLLWLIPVPGDGQVKGQIVGIPPSTSKENFKAQNTSGLLVAYSFQHNSTKLFAISNAL